MIDVPLLALEADTEDESALPIPRPVRAGDAAADLPARNAVLLQAGCRHLMPTGFSIALPVGSCGLLLPRSGLALKHGVTLLNSPGLVDSGYRGELKVLLHNTSNQPVQIQRGDRVAQLLVLSIDQLNLVLTSTLPPGPDDRGEAGFGSSGA